MPPTESPIIVQCFPGFSRARGFSNAQGPVRFTLTGSGTGARPPAGPCLVSIVADGIDLGRTPVEVYDLDGANGVNVSDFSVWLGDYATGEYIGRADCDGDGRLGINNRSLLVGAYGSGNSSASAVLCR